MKEWNFSIFPNQTFIDLTLYQFGGEKCKPGHMFGPAARNHYLFHYILHGQGTLRANNSSGVDVTYHLSEGEGFMIFPGQITTYVADHDDPWEYMWIEFDGLKVKETLSFVGLKMNTPVYHASFHDQKTEMLKHMEHIVQSQDASPFDLIGHMYLMIDHLVHSIKKPENRSSNKLSEYYMHETNTFIEEHYGDDITVEDIADHVGLNRSYFGKLFKKETGQTPQAFLMGYRMVKACEYLVQSNMSITDVASAVGYNNPLHFSRAFKNVYHVSPLNYRKKNKKY